MDGYKKYFYASTRIYEFKRAVFTEEEESSVQTRIDMRRSMQCKSFDWYMYNFLPELEAPPMDALYYGEVMNIKTKGCFEVLASGYLAINYNCYDHKIIPFNYFRLTDQGLLQYKDKCVAFDETNPALYVAECPVNGEFTKEMQRFGKWRLRNRGHVWGYMVVTIHNEHESSEWCISQVTNSLKLHPGVQMPQVKRCVDEDPFQTWIWTYKFDYSL